MGIKRKIFVEDLIVLLIVIVSPIASLPFIIFQIWRRKRFIYFGLLSVFIGIVASSIAPTGDLYRIYSTYFHLQQGGFNGLWNELTHSLDFTLIITLFTLAKLEIGMQWLVFFVVTLTCSVIFFLFLKSAEYNKRFYKQDGLMLITFFSILFLIDFFTYGLKLRAPLGQLSILVFFYWLIFEKKSKYWVLFVGALTHFSTIIVVPIVFLTKTINIKQAKKYYTASLLLMFFVADLIIITYQLAQPILEIFPVFNRRLSFYIIGKWGTSYLDGLSLNALIRHYAGVLIFVSVQVIYWLKLKIKEPALLIYYATINLLFSFPNVFNRFYLVPVLLTIFALIREYNKSLNSNVKFSLVSIYLLLITFGFASINILAQRRPLKISYTNEIFFSSSFQMLSRGYTKEWMLKNVNKKGLIRGDENGSK